MSAFEFRFAFKKLTPLLCQLSTSWPLRSWHPSSKPDRPPQRQLIFTWVLEIASASYVWVPRAYPTVRIVNHDLRTQLPMWSLELIRSSTQRNPLLVSHQFRIVVTLVDWGKGLRSTQQQRVASALQVQMHMFIYYAFPEQQKIWARISRPICVCSRQSVQVTISILLVGVVWPVSTLNQGESLSHLRDGPPENIQQTSDLDCIPSAGQAQLLLLPLISGEERLEAHFQFKISLTPSRPSVLQDGHPPISPGLSRKVYPPVSVIYLVLVRKYSYVGSLSRFRGCLLPRCDGTVYQLKVIPRTFTPLGGRHLPQDLWIKFPPPPPRPSSYCS